MYERFAIVPCLQCLVLHVASQNDPAAVIWVTNKTHRIFRIRVHCPMSNDIRRTYPILLLPFILPLAVLVQGTGSYTMDYISYQVSTTLKKSPYSPTTTTCHLPPCSHLQSFANIEESPQVLVEPKTVHIDEHLKGEPS